MEVTPETKVAALLDAYPELEDALIKLAPPFKKLKNPLLRRSVARVASLRQAASAARLPVEDLVNHLRAAVGQAPLTAEGSKDEEYLRDHPEWFDVTKISASITEGENDEIVELVTSFVPAPGIDILRKKGFEVWSVQGTGEEIRTYVARPRTA
jgi:hypothetical protein